MCIGENYGDCVKNCGMCCMARDLETPAFNGIENKGVDAVSKVIVSNADWRGKEMTARNDWVHRFTEGELAEIENALRTFQKTGKTIGEMEKSDFPLNLLPERFNTVRDYLEDGPGLFLLRGIPVDKYSKDELRLIYWGLGKHFGTAVSQSSDGDLLGDVRNLGVDINSPKGRGYKSNQKLTYHTDSADVVALLVLRTAKSGGLSMIVSSLAIHNEIARTRPDLLEVLYQPFYWSWQSQEPAGGLPYYQQPIYTLHNGKFSSRYIRTHIISAQRFPEVPRLTPAQEEAMALIDTLAASQEFQFSMMFEPGDLQLLNNHVTYHSRTQFDDYQELDRRRHLLRMWLSVPNSRDLSPQLGTIYQDQKGGTVRGGFPSRTGNYAYETERPVD